MHAATKKTKHRIILLVLVTVLAIAVPGTGCFKPRYYPQACIKAPELGYISSPVHFSSACSRNASQFQWDFGDSTTSTEPNPAHIYQSGGQYRVELTVKGDNPDMKSIDFVLISIN